jgi:twinkle protein
MARVIENDDIDFAAYEGMTEAKVKVRPASAWADDLRKQFEAQERGNTDPSMTSTKLRGGLHFRAGEVTVWAGFNGHRKSMFAGQVALDLVAAGQRVLVASFEMSPERTLGRMARQAAAKRYPSPAWLDAFTRWTDGRLWLFDHMGRVNASRCLAVCRYFADELKGQHVFIDSLMMVCASEDTFDEQKQFVTDLCRLAQETGLHVHLVAHCRKPHTTGEDRPPTKYDVRGTSAISDQASNVVTVWANKAKRKALEANPGDEATIVQPDALVGVEKQRNGAWEGSVKLWFDEMSYRFVDHQTAAVEPYAIEVAFRGAA